MKKIFKDKENVYILTIDDNYIQMTHNKPDKIFNKFPACGIYYTKNEKKYYTMFVENEREIPKTELMDEFKVLIFLKTYFSDEAASDFLEACKSI